MGIQSALEEVSQSLLVGERLCAFLDDLYLLCEPGRVRHLYDLVSESLHRNAGIQLHQGKTRVWNRSGTVPDNVDSLGEEVWRTDGIKILGTPLGNAQFVAEHTQERLEEEQPLWDAIPSVPDLQCAWQILVQSANPRANHTTRTLPPRLSLEYARGHDKGMWDTAKGLLQQLPGSDEELREAEMVARLPMRMGGLGLRSAERCADAAYWASWADALEMIHQRTPAIADMVVRAMEDEAPAHGCLSDLQIAARRLDNEGFWWRPSWKALRDGRRPPTNTSSEPGEWTHGWQYWASSISDTFFRKSSLLSSRAAASRAHLRSHSGCNAGAALAHAPTTKEYTIPPQLFRVLLLERLQLPLPVTEATCEGCHSVLDARGRHRAACTLSGRVKKRATPIERVLARVCREADAYLRDMNVDVAASDGRRTEVLAQDLPCFGGAQLAVDITLRCVLTRAGEPHRNAADVDGAVLVNARRDKEAKYPELVASRRCKLVVVGIETGGRWSEEAVDFVRQLSVAKAEEVPSFMRRSVSLSWERRWTRMLSVVCATAFAASLVEPARQCESICWTGGDAPPLADLLWQDPRGRFPC